MGLAHTFSDAESVHSRESGHKDRDKSREHYKVLSALEAVFSVANLLWTEMSALIYETRAAQG